MKNISIKIFTIILLLILANYGHSNQVDSLKAQLNKTTGKDRIQLLLELNEALLSSNPTDALKFSEEALDLSRKLNDKYLIASSHQSIGKAYYELNLLESAESNQKSALKIFTALGDSSKIGSLLDNLGDTYDKLGKIDSAIIIFEQAGKVFQMIGEKKNEAMAYSSIGLLKWKMGKNSEALRYHFQAYELRKKLGLDYSIAMSANNIGVIYWRLGNYQKALEYYIESLRLREKLNDKKGIIVANNNIGYIYLKLNSFDKAESIFQKSLSDSKTLNYLFGVAYSNHLLGILYLKKNELQESIEHSQEAVRLYHEINELNSVAYSMNYLGEAYSKLGNYKKAQQIFLAALDTARKANDKFSLATTYHNFAKINIEQNNLKQAIQNLDKSLELAYEENFIDLIIEGNLLYSQIMKKQGNPNKALEYYEKYVQEQENLRLEQISTNITEWESKYQLEQKEYENLLLKQKTELQQAQIEKEKLFRYWLTVIILLLAVSLIVFVRFYNFKRKANKQILKQKEELEKLNKRLMNDNIGLEKDIQIKDRIFSLIAHDLKSPFNTLLNYADLLISDSNDLPKEKVIEYAKIIYRSSEKLFDLTDNLLNWSIYQFKKSSLKKEKVNIKELMELVKEFYNEYYTSKNIKISLDVANDLVLTTDKSMLYSVLRNLISNAIKFTQPNGFINLSAYKENGSVKISVEDNGVGIPANRLSSLFDNNSFESTQGTAKEKGTGIGLMLCKNFTEALDGKIEVESEVGVGTKFILTFPTE